MSRMSARDRITVALLGLFVLIAVTVELYFVLAHGQLPARAHANPFARMFQIYGAADRAYFDEVSPLALGLEGINVFVTQPLNLWLAWAIWRRRPYRWALQLAVGAYLTYSVVLYFVVAHLSGVPTSPRALLLLYGANGPWLAGYAWLTWQAARALLSAPAIVQRDRVAPVVEQLGQQAAEVEPRRQGGDDGQGSEALAPQ